MNVFVTNCGDTPLTIGWDGVLYNFEKNVTVEIPEGAARQIFGHGCEDKEFVLVRHGWIKLHSELEEGLKILEQFVITNELPVKNSSLPSAVGSIPLQIQKSARGKSSLQRVA